MTYETRINEMLKLLKEKSGARLKALTEKVKEQNRLHRALLECLAGGEKTVPELAEETGIETQVVFWHVNALRKYGRIRDGGKRGSYLTYARAAKGE